MAESWDPSPYRLFLKSSYQLIYLKYLYDILFSNRFASLAYFILDRLPRLLILPCHCVPHRDEEKRTFTRQRRQVPAENLNRFAAARFFLLAVFLSSFRDLSRFSLLLGIACSRPGWSGTSFSASKQRASGQRDDIHDRSVFEAQLTFEKANELFKSQHRPNVHPHCTIAPESC